MINTAIVDSGPLLSLFDQKDRNHSRVKAALHDFRAKGKGRLICTWPIITEVAYILSTRVHFKAQVDFFEWIHIGGGLDVFDLSIDHLARIVELQEKYSDLPMDFADATLVITAEVLNLNKIFSTDSDFSIYRFLKDKHFTNILS